MRRQQLTGLALLEVARLAAGTSTHGDAARAPAAAHALATVLRAVQRRGFTRRAEQQLRQAVRTRHVTPQALNAASAAAALLNLHERELLQLAHESMTSHCAGLGRRFICKGPHRG